MSTELDGLRELPVVGCVGHSGKETMNYNKCIIAGNLSREPELRYTPKGTAIVKLSVAINRSWRNEAGESKKEVTFVDVDSFGKQAETVAKYFKKGQPILVEGRLKLDQWEDKTTHQKRSALKVVMEGFSFVSSKSDPQSAAEDPQPDVDPEVGF